MTSKGDINETKLATLEQSSDAEQHQSEDTLKDKKQEDEDDQPDQQPAPIGCFARYLTVWVALTMIIAVVLGYFVPAIPNALNQATIDNVSIPIAVFIWIMVYPMMLQIDVAALKAVRYNYKPLLVTSGLNYLIQPFSMYAISLLFFRVVYRHQVSPELADQYIAGAVILGGSPCTAMVFVWSALVKGNAAYTLTQVALNDVLIFILYIPTIMLLLRVTHITIPWGTAFLSVALFMCAPAIFAMVTRELARRRLGDEHFEEWIHKLMKFLEPFSMAALLLTIFAIFAVQGTTIVDQPAAVFMIALPLTIQTFFMFTLAFGIFYKLGTVFEIAAPGCFIATSNFFELAVAVTMALFGANSAPTLVTTVGVLVEVPLMLTLVWIAIKCKHLFPSEHDEKDKIKLSTKEALEEDVDPENQPDDN